MPKPASTKAFDNSELTHPFAQQAPSGRRQFLKRLAMMGLLGAGGSFSSLAKGDSQVTTTRPGGFKTGVALDPFFFKHDMPDHPEGADRLKAIDALMEKQALWPQLKPVKTRLASREELAWVHDAGYISEIEAMSEHAGDQVDFYDPYAGDTYINQHSFAAARMAAGSHIEMNLAIYDRQLDHGMALLRPPGHHALKNKAMGFCLFNSDMIAARALQQYRGVKKIAIIDFDVHHGNGTQALSKDDPNIMAISIHQHPFWPMTGGANLDQIKHAPGTVINLPFQKGAGDATYLDAYDQIIHSQLEAFAPEHILVFAGFDAHWLDPLAEHRMSVLGFNKLVKKCMQSASQLCQGRIGFSLGGGYNLESLAHCTVGTLHTLLDTPTQFENPLGPPSLGEVDYSDTLAKLKAQFLS